MPVTLVGRIAFGLALLAGLVLTLYAAAWVGLALMRSDVALELKARLSGEPSLPVLGAFEAHDPPSGLARWIRGCLNNRPSAASSEAPLVLRSFSSQVLDGLKPTEHAVRTLDEVVANQIRNIGERAESAYTLWQATTLTAIALGLCTTILVSLSSAKLFEDNPRLIKMIRVAAIIFPALGTAMAAVTGFYSPQAEWSLATRNLASLRQLQTQASLEIWHFDCIDRPALTADQDKNRHLLEAKLSEWAKRLAEIQAPGNAGRARGVSEDPAPVQADPGPARASAP